MTYVLILLALWVVFNWVAPFAAIYRADRISPGRLPPELFTWADARKVRFYISDLHASAGYSVWAPPLHVVIFDRNFFLRATPQQVRYVVAHELAHFSYGHHWRRWLAVVSLAVIFPSVRRWLERTEDEADTEAERRTGLPRSIIHRHQERKEVANESRYPPHVLEAANDSPDSGRKPGGQ